MTWGKQSKNHEQWKHAMVGWFGVVVWWLGIQIIVGFGVGFTKSPLRELGLSIGIVGAVMAIIGWAGYLAPVQVGKLYFWIGGKIAGY